MKVYMYKAYGHVRYTLSNEPMLTTEGIVYPVEIPAEVKKLTFEQLLRLIVEKVSYKEIVEIDPNRGSVKVYFDWDSDDGHIYYEYSVDGAYLILPKNDLPPKIVLVETEFNDFGTCPSELCLDPPEWLEDEDKNVDCPELIYKLVTEESLTLRELADAFVNFKDALVEAINNSNIEVEVNLVDPEETIKVPLNVQKDDLIIDDDIVIVYEITPKDNKYVFWCEDNKIQKTVTIDLYGLTIEVGLLKYGGIKLD